MLWYIAHMRSWSFDSPGREPAFLSAFSFRQLDSGQGRQSSPAFWCTNTSSREEIEHAPGSARPCTFKVQAGASHIGDASVSASALRCASCKLKVPKQIGQLGTSLAYPLASDALRGLHLSCAMCPFLAVVRVNSAPHRGQMLLDAVPDFSRWCRRRLLNVENCLPLHPCSQH